MRTERLPAAVLMSLLSTANSYLRYGQISTLEELQLIHPFLHLCTPDVVDNFLLNSLQMEPSLRWLLLDSGLDIDTAFLEKKLKDRESSHGLSSFQKQVLFLLSQDFSLDEIRLNPTFLRNSSVKRCL